VAETGEPYAFDGNDPLNAIDPLGLWWGSNWYHRAVRAFHRLNRDARKVVRAVVHSTVEHDLVDVPQDAAYLQYWGSFEAISHVNKLGAKLGPVGSVAAYVATAPFVPDEATGLAGDAAGNIAKGETIWQEGSQDQPLLGNEPGGRQLSSWLGDALGSSIPTHMVFPGLNRNGTINFAF
jgi:hypothetical protein